MMCSCVNQNLFEIKEGLNQKVEQIFRLSPHPAEIGLIIRFEELKHFVNETLD